MARSARYCLEDAPVAGLDHRPSCPRRNCGKELPLFFSTASSHPPPSPLPPPQINFESRKEGDVLNNCLMTVDGRLVFILAGPIFYVLLHFFF